MSESKGEPQAEPTDNVPMDVEPPGEHDSELPDENDDAHTSALQEENAGTSEDQPSQ